MPQLFCALWSVLQMGRSDSDSVEARTTTVQRLHAFAPCNMDAAAQQPCALGRWARATDVHWR